MEVFRSGYVGGSVTEATEWIAEKSQGSQRICVPFAGIGRAIVAMARHDTVITSFDTQRYSRCIIDGIFAAEDNESNIDEIRYRKGYMYENRIFKNIDDRCAGFVDWVVQEGTLADKACIGSAMVRATLMARMRHWHTNIEGLWKKFETQREYNQAWLRQPGQFIHREGDFFKSNATQHEYDLLHIDPPKVVNYSDVYSNQFTGFNSVLCGEKTTLPKWSRRNSIGYFKQTLQVPAPRIIFMYVSGVFPDYDTVKKELLKQAHLEEEIDFYHNGRTDYGLLLTRG